MTSCVQLWAWTAASTPALLTEAAALAAVALIGYLFGRRTRHMPEPSDRDASLTNELTRAMGIAGELQMTALRVRRELAAHQGELAAFQKRLTSLQAQHADAPWQQLGAEAENLLGPTLKLATNLSSAYDQLRKQSVQLMTFAGSRVDSVTGVHNRRAMHEQLDVLFSMCGDDQQGFSLALFSFSTHDDAVDERALTTLAQLLQKTVRGTDFVARYSGDEFAVLMPQTSLAGATVFCQRLLLQGEEELGRHVWGGVVETQPEDHPQRLLSRADSALYSARTCGETCLFQHTGGMLRRRGLSMAPSENPGETVPPPSQADGFEAESCVESDANAERPSDDLVAVG